MRFSFLVFCLWYVPLAYAQQPGDALPDAANVNIPYLEHLTKIKIDSVRNGLGLKSLYNDSILYIAAGDHSRYLIGKELSHFQPENELKKNPQERAIFYGAVNYLTGENITRTILNERVAHKIKYQKDQKVTFDVNTYDRAAYSMAFSWVNSPPHYANIITPDYDVTGMAISIDPNTNQVTAVQKFGNVLYRYEFSNTGVLFPFAEKISSNSAAAIKDVSNIPVRKDYPWKLKPGTPEDFQKVKEMFTGGSTVDQITRNGNEDHLITHKVQAMRKLMRRRRDGFALELVKYEPFHCGNPEYYQLPSRRNDKYIFNGHILKPVYKKTIMKEFKKQVKEIRKDKKERVQAIKRTKSLPKEDREAQIKTVKRESKYPDFIDALVGVYPDELSLGYIERNVIMLQKRRAAYVFHYSGKCDAAELTGDTLSLFPKYDMVTINDIVNTKRLQFKVPFERNAYEITEEQIKIIRDSINNGLTVKGIDIEAWASVEGFEKINLDLQEKRTATMRNIIAPLEADSTIKVNIKAGENWELFYQQIKHTPYHSWAKLPKDTIKKRLESEQHLAAFNEFLNAQRRAELELVYEESIGVNSSAMIAMGVLRSFIAKIEVAKPKDVDPVMVQAATTMQKYIYERFTKGEIRLQEILDIRIPFEKRFIPLLINRLWFEYNYAYKGIEPAKWPKEFYRQLNYCAKDKNAGIVARYNYCAFLVNSWKTKPFPGSPSLDDLKVLIDELPSVLGQTVGSTPVKPEHIDSLKFNFHLKRVHYLEKSAPGSVAFQNSLKYIYTFYKKQVLSDSMTYVVGSFFNKHQRYNLAKSILEEKATSPQPELKILSLYLKLTYVHVEEADDMSFYQNVMQAYSKMPEEKWCDLFVGPCNISFQAFDYEPLRDFYCEKCAERGNDATR